MVVPRLPARSNSEPGRRDQWHPAAYNCSSGNCRSCLQHDESRTGAGRKDQTDAYYYCRNHFLYISAFGYQVLLWQNRHYRTGIDRRLDNAGSVGDQSIKCSWLSFRWAVCVYVHSDRCGIIISMALYVAYYRMEEFFDKRGLPCSEN